MAYDLELPAKLAAVHPVIHISLLMKCVGDPASMPVKDSLSYEDVPIEILDHHFRRLRNKEFASIKVLWRSQSADGSTCKAEVVMKAKYPHLFPSDSTPASGNSSSSLLQSIMRKFSFRVMFPQFVL